ATPREQFARLRPVARPTALPVRTRLAANAGLAVAGLSRRVGAGEGSVIGGRVLLAVDPGALSRLAAGRTIALVSGTTGTTASPPRAGGPRSRGPPRRRSWRMPMTRWWCGPPVWPVR